MKRLALPLIALAGCLSPTPEARAADVNTCIEHHEAGQVSRKQSRFVAAKQHFLACAAEPCPPIVRSDCTALASEMDAAIPSVVLAAVDPRGDDVPGATVRVDGGEPRAIDGRALSLDPGPHRFVFEAPGTVGREVTVALGEAERFRRVGAVLDANAPESDGGVRVHPLALVFGGVGAAATASFAFFALNGKATERGIRACNPSCTGDDVDTMRTQYLIADVSLVVALASFSVGTWFFLHPPGTGDASDPAKTAARRVQWAPAVAPGMAGLTARGVF